MDSLSQIVLGAACGEVVLGRKIGNKAQLIGAIAGTLPDLDILMNPFFSEEIIKIQIHRSYSHSMLVLLLLSFPLAWITHRLFKKEISYKGWYLLWSLALVTHALLDCCTTYGTQFFLPFTHFLVGFNNIAVLDPFWTLPFMFILGICLFMRRENPNRMKFAIASIVYATLYMGYTVVNKYNVHEKFETSLDQQHIFHETLYTSPSMFNNWLWAGIAVTNDTIYLAEYSTLQSETAVPWLAYERNLSVLENHPAQREIKILQWFSQGKYFVREVNGEIHFFIVKWGRSDYRKTEPHEAFVFYWRIFQENDEWKAAPVQPTWENGEFRDAWNALWHRVVTAN